MLHSLRVGRLGVYVGIVFGEHVAFWVDIVRIDIAERHLEV